MWLLNTWITIATIIIAISSSCTCQIEFQNNNTNGKVQTASYNKQNTKNSTNVLNNNNVFNSQVLLGDIIANTMKRFLPFSNVNKNCTRDGRQYMIGLNNQIIWAVQSK